MRSLPHALLWETLSHGRWSLPMCFLLGNALPLFLYALLSGYSIDPHDPAFLVLQFSFLPIIIFQFAIGIVIALGPLSRLYTAPISTSSLVAWRMFSGAVLLGGETAAAAWLYNTLFQVDWPIWGFVLFAAAAWCAFQLLLCVDIQHSVVSFLIAGFPCVAVFLWLQSRYGAWFSMPVHAWPQLTTAECFTLVGVMAISYVFTVMGVKRARCGEPLPTLGIWSWLVKTWDKFREQDLQRRPFRSAVEAQLWYEWHLKGAALPVISAIALIIGAAGCLESYFVAHYSLPELYEAVLFFGGFLTLLAVVAGLFLGTSYNTKAVGQRELQLDDVLENVFHESMGNFLSTRPISNSDFAKAILKTAFHSSLIAWTTWFVGCVAFLLLAWFMNQFPEAVLPPKIGQWYFPLTILGPWIAMANMAVVGLSGRAAKITFTAVGLLFSYCFSMAVLKFWFSNSALEQVSSVSLVFGSLLVVLASLWAFFKAHRKKILGAKALITATATSLGIAMAAILLSPENLLVVAYPMIFALAALVVLPFASTPLAIAWNRHR